MRLSKSELQAPVKGDLPFTFSNEQISVHGGLELFRRYFQHIDLAGRLRKALQGLGVGGDYGAVAMLVSLIGLLLIGGSSRSSLQSIHLQNRR